jgi:hypothetical protein
VATTNRPHERAVRIGSRGSAVCRVGRLDWPGDRRRAVDPVVRPATGEERMGALQQGAGSAAHGGGPDAAGRAGRGRGCQAIGHVVDARRRREPGGPRRPGVRSQGHRRPKRTGTRSRGVRGERCWSGWSRRNDQRRASRGSPGSSRARSGTTVPTHRVARSARPRSRDPSPGARARRGSSPRRGPPRGAARRNGRCRSGRPARTSANAHAW